MQLLSDDADWNVETWSMRTDVLDRLASTLEILAAPGPHGLVVEALWVGDEPKNTVSLTPRELAEANARGKPSADAADAADMAHARGPSGRWAHRAWRVVRFIPISEMTIS